MARGLGVEKALQEKLGMPSFAVCSVLHLWRFDEPLPPEKPPVELDALEPGDVIVKRTLRRYGYPPDMQELATETVLKQAELIAAELTA